MYLYAIDIYSANLEKGQRWAAEAARKYFGLESFAHTTLGRALKALVNSLGSAVKEAEEPNAEPTVNGEKIGCTNQEKTVQACERQNGSQLENINFFSVRSTEALRKQAGQFLGGSLIRAFLPQCIEIGQALAWEWFKKYGRLLM